MNKPYDDVINVKELYCRYIDSNENNSGNTLENWAAVSFTLNHLLKTVAHQMVVGTYCLRLPFYLGHFYIKEKGMPFHRRLFNYEQSPSAPTKRFRVVPVRGDLKDYNYKFRFTWAKLGLPLDYHAIYHFSFTDGFVNTKKEYGWGKKFLKFWFKKVFSDPWIKDYHSHII